MEPMGDHGRSSKKEVAVVLLPVLGMGHLVAMVELAKHLLLHCSDLHSDLNLTITILNLQPLHPMPQISSYIASASSSNPGITFKDLPKVDPPPGTKPESFMAALLELHKPLVKDALEASLVPVVALVIDLFFTSMIDVAKDLGIPSYIFFTSSASFLGLMLHLPTIARQLPSADEYEGKTVPLPGFSDPLPLMSMPEPLMKPEEVAVQVLCKFASQYPDANGILINTFVELQSAPMKALEEGLYHLKAQAVYAVGPILSLEHKGGGNKSAGAGAGSDDGRHECIRWLDEQPLASVVFLCFGSMGGFTAAQAKKMAYGLEVSGQRFLWVLRSLPAQAQQDTEEGAAKRITMRTPVDAVLDEVLPEGFLERTRERGMVWPSFAPQAEILAHAAVGGFVTHCGWNSCLESIWYGVPMAAWPLYAEQHFNAFELTREMGIAVEIQMDRRNENAVTAEEVERAVTVLMGQEDGGKAREQAKQMNALARRALSKGGSSFLALEKFVQELRSRAI